MSNCTLEQTKNALYDELRLTGSYKKPYYTTLLFASAVAAIGLQTGSQEAVIGSMLLSPLGGVVVGFALSLIKRDWSTTANLSKHLVGSIAVMIVMGYVIGLLSKDMAPTQEMTKRYSETTAFDKVTALIIGTAMVYSIYVGNVGLATGAGIAISLLPPIVNVGMTYPRTTVPEDERERDMKNSLIIGLTNMAGVVGGTFIMDQLYCHLQL